MLLTTSAINGIKSYIQRTVKYARYRIGSTYYQVPLNDVTIDASGVIRISFMIQPESTNAVVNQVQVFDTAGALWFEKSVSLNMGSVAEGFYYLVKLSITEVDE